MKKVICITFIAACVLFTGCSPFRPYECPNITEFGITDTTDDNIYIMVQNAKTGLCGYEIVETEEGIDVIFHYEKKEKK